MYLLVREHPSLADGTCKLSISTPLVLEINLQGSACKLIFLLNLSYGLTMVEPIYLMEMLGKAMPKKNSWEYIKLSI